MKKWADWPWLIALIVPKSFETEPRDQTTLGRVAHDCRYLKDPFHDVQENLTAAMCCV